MPAGGDPIELSVVVPAYNEEKRIGECLRRVQAFMVLKSWEWELVVVSGGRADGTNRIVQDVLEKRRDKRVRLIVLERNEGKGMALRRGVMEAEGRIILITDAGLPAPIKECEKLIAALEAGCDVATGSRVLKEVGCDVQQSPGRFLARRAFHWLIRPWAPKGIHDTQCGFRCFKRAAAREIFSSLGPSIFGYDAKALCLARKKGFKINEVPVMWREVSGRAL